MVNVAYKVNTLIEKVVVNVNILKLIIQILKIV